MALAWFINLFDVKAFSYYEKYTKPHNKEIFVDT